MTKLSQSSLSLRLIRVLIENTVTKAIEWKPAGYDCFVSDVGKASIIWTYWYNAEGITTGRQGTIVRCCDSMVPVFWGTEGMSLLAALLREIDPAWAGYFERLQKNSENTMASQSTHSDSWQKSTLDLLRRVNAATINGVIQWRCVCEHPFAAVAEIAQMKISRLYPVDFTDVTLPSLAAEVSIPGCNLSFVSGTEGFDLIEQVLSNAFPSIAEEIRHRNRCITQAIEFFDAQFR